MKVGLVLANSFEQENLDTMPKILKCLRAQELLEWRKAMWLHLGDFYSGRGNRKSAINLRSQNRIEREASND